MTEENAEEEEMLKWAKGYANKQGWTLNTDEKQRSTGNPGFSAEQKKVRKTILSLPPPEW